MSSPGLAERAPATEPSETADDGYVAYDSLSWRSTYTHTKSATSTTTARAGQYRATTTGALTGIASRTCSSERWWFGTIETGTQLVVDVLLPAAIEGYEPDAGAHALILFVLAEAYKCGGTMEIEFTENVVLPCSPRCGVCRHLAGGRRCGASGADKFIVCSTRRAMDSWDWVTVGQPRRPRPDHVREVRNCDIATSTSPLAARRHGGVGRPAGAARFGVAHDSNRE